MASIALPAPSGLAAKPIPNPKPLSRLGLLLLPLLLRTFPAQRSELERRAQLTRRAAEQKRNEAEMAKELVKEAATYEKILQTTWARLGEYHRPMSEFSGPERRRPKKTHYVEFEAIFSSP